MGHAYRWQPLDGIGLEHLDLDYRDDVIVADGVVVGDRGDGADQPQLAGCLDVDIAATPFTNTLPVRRLGAALQRRTPIAVVYVAVPSLSVRRMEQAYTRLGGGRYLYEGPIGAFQAELELDADGLVRHYPSLFTRLSPA